MRRVRPPALLAILLLTAGCPPSGEPAAPPGEDTAIVPPSQAWHTALPQQTVPVGLVGLRASQCGVCHTAIYAEWRTTTHAAALRDPQFLAEWRKDGELPLCLNCHTPLQNQQPHVVVGLREGDLTRPVLAPNPEFDEALKAEAITCAVCHVRDGAVLGAGTSTAAPHPVRAGSNGLSQATCESCHNIQAVITESLICNFATGDEWRERGGAQEGPGCIDCHMPRVMRPMVPGRGVRPGRRHTWFGAGIAKSPDEVADVRAAYRAGYDVELRATLRGDGAERRVVVELAITNARAGHYLPTGDPERFISLSLELVDDVGTRLWHHRERIGEVWSWHPKAERLSENRLRPGERRDYTFEVAVSDLAQPPARVALVARNHRMTEENARATGILGVYPLAAETLRIWAPVEFGGGSR